MTTTDSPPLYLGADIEAPTSEAWATAWTALHADRWLLLPDVVAAVHHAHPDLERKTIYSVIRTATANHLVEMQGTYRRRNHEHIDTRMIRRHPATQETSAP